MISEKKEKKVVTNIPLSPHPEHSIVKYIVLIKNEEFNVILLSKSCTSTFKNNKQSKLQSNEQPIHISLNLSEGNNFSLALANHAVLKGYGTE